MTNVKTSQSRVFTIENRAGPANIPVYQGRARALSPSWDLGDLTPIREPDPGRYGAFKIVDSLKGEKGLPTLSIQARYQFTISAFLELSRRGCAIDIQVHLGQCQDPRDFNLGWNKILVLEGADLSTWSAEDLGALEQGQNAVVHEQIDTSALDMYELSPLVMRELDGAEVMGYVIDVAICDAVTCGICGIPSAGCSHVFALTEGQIGSPGISAEIVFTDDGGITFGETNVATLGFVRDPSAMACVGSNLAVISAQAGAAGEDALHWAGIADILNNADVWQSTGVGFVIAGAPHAIFSLGSGHTWIVGEDGYIYFSEAITNGVVVQDAGAAAGANVLNDIHGYDENNLVAVGESGACALTRDGGANWGNVDTTDIGAVDLTCVWMKSADEWFIGTIQGRLYYTRDGGLNFIEKTFPGSSTGTVYEIVFATPTVGYLAHDIGGAENGRILRTIDGGYSWYVLPETTGAMPANGFVSTLAAVADCPNVVFGGGLAVDGVDGFFVKGA